MRAKWAIAGKCRVTLRLGWVPILGLALGAGSLIAQQPPAPERVLAFARETLGGFFVDKVLVWWRPVVVDPPVTQYRLRWAPAGTELTPESQLLVIVTPKTDVTWMETNVSLVARKIYDHEEFSIGVEAVVGSGAGAQVGPLGVTTALAWKHPSEPGDLNDDDERDVIDAVVLLLYLFQVTAGSPFQPSSHSKLYSGDTNGDGTVDLSDAIYLLEWLFKGGPLPAAYPVYPDVPVERAGNRLLFGAFCGDPSVSPMFKTMTHVRALETWHWNKRNCVLNLFSAWVPAEHADNLFTFQLSNIWNNRSVPMITWEPGAGKDAPSDIEAQVAGGAYDSFLRNWAGRMKTWLSGPDGKFGAPGTPDGADDRRAYLRLAHEMNGWWTPWNAVNNDPNSDNLPSDYVNMWRRVHDILVQEYGLDGSHIQWVWCVNNIDADYDDGRVTYKMEQYYPGTSYVDWVAIDGYNWGYSQPWTNSWDLPAAVYDGDYPTNRMLRRLKTLVAASPKPIAIAEYGTTSVTAKNPIVNSVETKQLWITDAMKYFLDNGIRMAVYFNLDKETDWAIFGGARGDVTFSYAGKTYNAYSAYKSAILSPRFLVTDSLNRRLLTEEQFTGSW